MSKPRFPTRRKLETWIPRFFLVSWLVCGIAVFAAAHVSQRSRAESDRADRTSAAVASVVCGYLVAGVVVSLLSAAHGCVWRRIGSRRRARLGKRAAIPRERLRKRSRLTERGLRLWYLGFLLAAAAALSVDYGLARWCMAGSGPDLLEPFAAFGTAVGALVAILAIHQLDPPRRRAVWWVLACVFLSAMVANGAKLLLARTRPQGFDFDGNVWTTFGAWLPPASMGQSFPSGHTATAAGLALALVMIYPRGRRLFLLLAVLVACQRLACGAHYLSDVLFGAAVSCLAVACCLRLARWFSANRLG
jgi:undecaprenyl-diphosphatase